MYREKDCNNKERGAITVFLALIFMSLIIFAGTVIDIVRITAADRKVQSVLNSSARSVLAGYDSELIGEYGIYGVGTTTDTMKNDFYRYLSVNLKEYHEGINFINITVDPENIEIQGMDSLLKDEVFKRQVQEYMKYRTPIIETANLIEQLQNIKLDKKVGFAKAEKITRDKSKELRAKTNEVNTKLAGIKKKITDLSEKKLEEIKNELLETLEISGSIYGENGEGLLEEYIQSMEDTNNKAEEGECIKDQSQEFEGVQENSKNLTSGLKKCLTEVNDTIQKVKPLEKELKTLKEELDDLKEKLSAAQKDEASSSEDAESIKDEIDKVKDSIEQLESRIAEEISGLKMRLGELSINVYSLKDESMELADKKTEELKSFINKKKGEIEKVLLRRLEKDWLISAGEFDKSSLTTGEDFGTMDEKASYNSSMQENEAERSNDTIVRSIEKLAEAVEKAASGSIEKVNTIEYIMDKFTFLTSKTERNHYFRKGEVEYIISGSDAGGAFSSIKNTEYYIVTNVLLQVWALRFAIDTIDEFVRSPVIFPPQRLAFSLIEGALDSSLDMFNMLNGEEVPICPKSFTAVKLKYSDHLKILLLMRPEEEILRKVRQLMQVNIKQVVDRETGLARSDFRLGDYSTVISASVEAKVNLFFLPLLKIDKLMPGSFEGGRYIIRKQIYVGY